MEQINVYFFSTEIRWAGYAKCKNAFYPEALVTEFFVFINPGTFRVFFCVLLLDGSPLPISEDSFIRYFIFAVYSTGNLAGWVFHTQKCLQVPCFPRADTEMQSISEDVIFWHWLLFMQRNFERHLSYCYGMGVWEELSWSPWASFAPGRETGTLGTWVLLLCGSHLNQSGDLSPKLLSSLCWF